MRAGSEDKDTLVSAAYKANRQRNNIVLQAYIIMYTKKGWIPCEETSPSSYTISVHVFGTGITRYM